GELGEVVRRMKDVERRAPLMAVNEVVPVGDDVVDRAAGLAERDAAVHAARALRRSFVFGQRENELARIAHALGDRQHRLGDAPELHEAGHLAHLFRRLAGFAHAAAFCFFCAAAAFAAVSAACISVSARRYSCGNTLTNLRRWLSQSSSTDS